MKNSNFKIVKLRLKINFVSKYVCLDGLVKYIYLCEQFLSLGVLV